MEQWKQIKGYDNYECSTEGRIRNKKTGRILKEQVNCNGYKTLTLYQNKYAKNERVHRIVASTFIYGKYYGKDVNHIDGNKLNNRVDNLEWCTRKDNVRHSMDIGVKAMNNFGKECVRVRLIETGEIYNSINECARSTGLDISGIRQCLNGRMRSYKWLHFERL